MMLTKLNGTRMLYLFSYINISIISLFALAQPAILNHHKDIMYNVNTKTEISKLSDALKQDLTKFLNKRFFFQISWTANVILPEH